jgi:Trk-type K+ transport systems, membrane components
MTVACGFTKAIWLLAISNVFMLLGALNFALHFSFLYSGKPSVYWRNEEARVFLLVVTVLSLGLAAWLWLHGRYGVGDALGFAFFEVSTFITSTGFTAADLTSWPPGTDLFLVAVAYLGGCAGSTAGGNKFIRNIVVFKLFRHLLQRALHPHCDAADPLQWRGSG